MPLGVVYGKAELFVECMNDMRQVGQDSKKRGNVVQAVFEEVFMKLFTAFAKPLTTHFAGPACSLVCS